MIVLAMDTTGPRGSLALADENGPIAEIAMEAPDGYSAVLFGAIDELLAKNATTIESIGLFAAASGPGTFTGVRIGLTCVKGLGEALGKPVCAVSNLEALAAFGTKDLRAVAIDARRGDVYAAVYDAHGNAVVSECLLKREEFTPEGDVEVVSYDGPLAAAIARIALERGGVDPAAIDANYIRRSDAELSLNATSSSRLRM
jgi:tRNA threonylcarbamoyladenosine biosynthesis protein TsaB